MSAFRAIADIRLTFQSLTMDEQRPRPFSESERAFLERVAEKLTADGGERLRHDLHIAQVTTNGDFLLVNLPGYERPEYRGHRNLQFEGRMLDTYGGAMSVLVNMDQNDRLLAVEFISWEGGGPASPDWSTLAIEAEPPTVFDD
ncbi:MAG TPA: hypothetical protein VF614_07815 [Chthoniobacteraceae bacterium]|jgi:hypothetical protein